MKDRKPRLALTKKKLIFFEDIPLAKLDRAKYYTLEVDNTSVVFPGGEYGNKGDSIVRKEIDVAVRQKIGDTVFGFVMISSL